MVFINHEGGVSPQIAFGKPGVGVNTRLRTVFINHEGAMPHRQIRQATWVHTTAPKGQYNLAQPNRLGIWITHILRTVRAGGTSTTDSTPAAYFKCRGTACRAPKGGVWLREYLCDAADKNHPALRAPLLKKKGSLGRCSCGLYQGKGSGLPLQLGMVFINHESGESSQINIGKPGGTVNVKLGLIFNHEEHEVHEENTKVGVLVLPM